MEAVCDADSKSLGRKCLVEDQMDKKVPGFEALDAEEVSYMGGSLAS